LKSPNRQQGHAARRTDGWRSSAPSEIPSIPAMPPLISSTNWT